MYRFNLLSLFRRIIGSNKGLICFLPHGRTRSFSLIFPTRLFNLLFLIFILFLTVATFLSLKNVILDYSSYQALSDNNDKKKTVAAYQTLIKNYVVKHNQKRKQVGETIAVLFNPEIKGVGGSVNNFNPNHLHDFSSHQIAPDNWDDYFSEFSDQDFISFVDRYTENMNSIYTMIDRFEILISQRKRVSKSIPLSWPVRALGEADNKSKLSEKSKQEIQSSLKENFLNISVEEGTLAIDYVLSLVDDDSSSPKSLAIDIHNPMAVVSSSRGIVGEVKERNGLWKIEVQHEYGFSTYYYGLDEVSIKPGDLVNRLTMLGVVGNKVSPKKTPQLTYQIKIANKFVNPRDFLIFNY